MERLCERPGCSDRASVAYGMRAEDLVFWLDVLSDAASVDGGVLCRRHADSMIVPRSWTLDDLRDPDLHLFRPPAAVEQRRRRSRRPTAGASPDTEQLALGVDEEVDEPLSTDGLGPEQSVADGPGAGGTDTAELSDSKHSRSDPVATEGDVAEDHEAWTPNFDTEDDLDGLLSARSPLLARAFRGDDRPRELPGAE